MNCPHCGSKYTDVTDSRPVLDSCIVYRRRVCTDCKKKFTTYEGTLKNMFDNDCKTIEGAIKKCKKNSKIMEVIIDVKEKIDKFIS